VLIKRSAGGVRLVVSLASYLSRPPSDASDVCIPQIRTIRLVSGTILKVQENLADRYCSSSGCTQT